MGRRCSRILWMLRNCSNSNSAVAFSSQLGFGEGSMTAMGWLGCWYGEVLVWELEG